MMEPTRKRENLEELYDAQSLNPGLVKPWLMARCANTHTMQKMEAPIMLREKCSNEVRRMKLRVR